MSVPPAPMQHAKVGPNDLHDTFAAMIRRRMLPIAFSGAAVLAIVVAPGVLPTKAAAVTAKPGTKPGPTSAEIEKRADALLARMTLDEKIDYLGGADGFYIRAVKRLGLPALRMADGPFGVRTVGPSPAYPAGIGLGASWDVALANRVGAAIGRDARARGVQIML